MHVPSKKDVKFALLMSFIATFFVSGVIVLVNLGFAKGMPTFFLVWARSWFIAFILVTLAILFLAPVVRKWVS